MLMLFFFLILRQNRSSEKGIERWRNFLAGPDDSSENYAETVQRLMRTYNGR